MGINQREEMKEKIKEILIDNSYKVDFLGTKEESIKAILDTSTLKATIPLQMEWQPKEDITAYELAICLPYFFRTNGVMPYEVDMEVTHFRHFKITDRNK